MRRAYNDIVILLNNESKIIGVALGFDFCAEHEFGIQKIKKSLGIPEITRKVNGLNGRTATDYSNIYFGSFTDKKVKYFYFLCKSYFLSYHSNPEQRAEDIKKKTKEIAKQYLPYSDREISTAWDDGEFIVVTKNEELYNCLVSAVEKKTLCVGAGVSKGPFSRGGIAIIDSNGEEDEDMVKKDLEYIEHQERASNVSSWLEPRIRKTKGFYALIGSVIDEKRKEEKNTKYDIIFWLNPTDQRKYNSGYFTVEDLLEWCEKDSGPVLRDK